MKLPNPEEFNDKNYVFVEKCCPHLEKITNACAKIAKAIEKMEERMVFIRNYATRKEQADAIRQEFPGWKTAIAFLVLDNREIDDKVVQKTIEKILEL